MERGHKDQGQRVQKVKSLFCYHFEATVFTCNFSSLISTHCDEAHLILLSDFLAALFRLSQYHKYALAKPFESYTKLNVWLRVAFNHPENVAIPACTTSLRRHEPRVTHQRGGNPDKGTRFSHTISHLMRTAKCSL